MDGEKLQILLVEDAEPDVFVVRESLGQSGLAFELKVLDDGEKAVDFVDGMDRDDTAPLPDVILLDFNLPKKSGPQVLERIRRSPRCAGIPVVVVTSSDSPRDKAEAARLGVLHYFRKPSRLDEFMKLGPLVRGAVGDQRQI